MQSKHIIMFFLLILFLSACSGEDTENTSLSFPSELFTLKITNGNECTIQVEKSKIEPQVIEDKKVHILTLEGKMPAGCGSLSMYFDPPNAAKQINVYLSSSKSSNEGINNNSKPFTISMPLNIMVEGYYTIVINDELKINYSYFNNK